MIQNREISIEKAQKLLKGITIPPRPTIMVQILEELKSSSPNINHISQLISNDISLTAATLKTVNSPFFGQTKQVSNIPHAVLLIGLTNTCNIVTSISLKNILQSGKSEFREKFWDKATEIAMISAYLTQKFTAFSSDA